MDEQIKKWHAEQIAAYRDEKPVYEVYADTLRSVLEKAASGVASMAIVQARPKGVPNFAEKIMRKRLKYPDPVNQLTDLCGARVITLTPEDMAAMCAFINKHFNVDEKNTDDAGARLGRTEFGYRSYHFVVRMVGPEMLGIPIPPEIGERRAEIQVRTVFQHAHAVVSHEQLYKNNITLPDAIHRDVARLAALLEETETLCSKVGRDVDKYRVSYGAYMTDDQMRDEADMLETVMENETDEQNKAALALRIAKICKARGYWDGVIAVLTDYKDSDIAAIRREYGYAKCQKNKETPKSKEYQDGQMHLARALELCPTDAETAAYLAESWTEVKLAEEKARELYREAFELTPGNAYHLASFLEYELYCGRSPSILPALTHTIHEALQTCRAHADAHIELPWAFFTMGKLYLFQGALYESLAAYSKAAVLCIADKKEEALPILERQLESLQRLEIVKTCIPGGDWMRECLFKGLQRLLLLAKAVSTDGGGVATGELSGMQVANYDQKRNVLIIAGGCEHHVESQLAVYEEMLQEALASFDGVVLCGGTTAGISGMVGRINSDVAAQGEKKFEAVAYCPAKVPSHVHSDTKNYILHQVPGEDFSVLEALQTWVDLLASGISPSRVKLLGINGGKIAAFEYRLATMLGAQVTILENSGRAAYEFLKDSDWNKLPNVVLLPDDIMTVRAFVNATNGLLTEEDVERAAKVVHEKFREDNKHVKIDPSMLEWEKVPDHLRDSSRAQVRYAGEILARVGYGLRPVSGDPVIPEFTKKEIELMAELEHGRWNAERICAGWTLGPRDPMNKVSPYLVSWEQLPESVRKWDRDAVVNFPDMFKEIGLEIYRLKP